MRGAQGSGKGPWRQRVLEAKTRQQVARADGKIRAVEKNACDASQIADEQVFRHAEIRKNVRLLMDHADSGCVRVGGRAQEHRRAVYDDLTRVRLMHALHDAGQRRFAGAVLADQREDFPRADRQGDFRQRVHNAEALAHAAEFKQGRHFLQSLSLKLFQVASLIRSALT